jgi:hypothetical protein
VKIDRPATAAQHYKDPKSYHTLDGREVLAGEDWLARKRELWERCGGRCEYMITPEIRCQREGQEPHHVIRRSQGRQDALTNLLCLCNHHHSMLDKRKPRWTSKEAMA